MESGREKENLKGFMVKERVEEERGEKEARKGRRRERTK